MRASSKPSSYPFQVQAQMTALGVVFAVWIAVTIAFAIEALAG